MTRNCIIFFPHNPFPPKSGAHKRVLAQISALRELGWSVTLASSKISSETPWQGADLRTLGREHGCEIAVHCASKGDRIFQRAFRKFERWTRLRPRISSFVYTPPGLRRWFAGLTERLQPSVVLMNYAYWDGLMHHPGLNHCYKAIDTLDMLSLQNVQRKALAACLPKRPFGPLPPDHPLLQENFYDHLPQPSLGEEMSIYDRYDLTIAITAAEAELIRKHTRHTRVIQIPVTEEPVFHGNIYRDMPILTLGPNPYNLQGYLFFVSRVLPLVFEQAPDFCLRITGEMCKQLTPAPGIVLTGFVPDLAGLYRESAFLVCPVYGGTGQQIKVVEAMAHGVPPICLEAGARGSPIRHEVNGIIVGTAARFAEWTVKLWRERQLCAELGESARNTIASECSASLMRSKLNEALEFAGAT